MNIQVKTLIFNGLLTVIFSLVTLTFSGCATLSKNECRLGDWQSIGYSDGIIGRSPSYVSEHQKSCARISISPNYKAWEIGRKEGLKEYCTESNAYQVGKRGGSFANVCPANTSDRLDRMYAKGKTLYDINKKIEEDQQKLDKYQEELNKLSEGEMLEFKTEKEARSYMIELYSKINKLKKNIRYNENLLKQLSSLN